MRRSNPTTDDVATRRCSALFSLALWVLSGTGSLGCDAATSDVAETGMDAGIQPTDSDDARPDGTVEEDVSIVPALPSTPAAWSTPIVGWPAALLSVDGRSDDDVWVVGADAAGVATALHWNGSDWTRHEPPLDGTLWWVQVVDDGTAFFGGEAGRVLRRVPDGPFEDLGAPGLARQTVFGLFAPHADEVWAVGGIGSRGGFVWHWRDDAWTDVPLPLDAPRLPHGDTAGLFKVWGSHDDLWFVGGLGALLHMHDGGPLARADAGTMEPLFTVAGTASDDHATRIVAVGGGADGVVYDVGAGRSLAAPPASGLLQGVAFAPDGALWVTGALGMVARLANDEWERASIELDPPPESLHAVWVSPTGAVWAVGGNVLSATMDEGILVHGAPDGVAPPTALRWRDEDAPSAPPPCPTVELPNDRRVSVARYWNEQTLHAIRRALPEPTVHARNLYHLSLAMHDAWAAFEPDYEGIVQHEDARATGDPTSDRAAAISHAAYRLLLRRYRHRTGGEMTVRCLTEAMTALGLDPTNDRTMGESPAALGNRIGETVWAHFLDDGANETLDYTDPTWRPRNPPLVVDDPGIRVLDASTWQPLDIARAVTQNGIAEPEGPQRYIGPHWGGVTPFAIRRPAFGEPWFPLGPRPSVQDPEMAEWVLDVIRRTAWLDIDDGAVVDVSPGRYGNNPLGSDDGVGHSYNPFTFDPYLPQLVWRGDFGRVLAEYWADGPNSETPPGHWNTIAHAAFDHPDFARRFYGEGAEVDRLTWDIWAFLLLNGALHDAAIVAWEAKRLYETARPMTLIRWMGQNGQRTDPAQPSWHPDGLLLENGLVEVITDASAAPGERHAHLRAHIGEIAIRTWPGEPSDPKASRSRLRWLRAVEWVPYQPRTFVNPAFPGYVSGHSTFSRAAAVVLHHLTGDPFFPGGLAEHVARRNRALEFELGPSTTVRLQWGTWYDAADQAGQSRIWGGIHILPDDWGGRQLGALVGEAAVEWGRTRVLSIQPLPGIGAPGDPLHRGDLPELPIDTPGAPPGGDPRVVVGQGRDTWEPLLEGATLLWERGHQGGHHLWLTLRVAHSVLDPLSDDDRNRIRTTFSVADPAAPEDGPLARANRIGGFIRAADAWVLTRSFAVLSPSLHPLDLSGQVLTVSASLEIPSRAPLESSVPILTACCQ
jgi:hypothetical protein